MTPWTKGKLEHDGITFQVKAYNQLGEVASGKTRAVVILTQDVFNAKQQLYAAIVDYTNETTNFISKPKTMEDIERKMNRVLMDKSKGPISSEAFEIASGMCLACYRLNEVLDAQMA